MEYRGIDVSKYQGKIDWPKVKAAGIQFAFVRVGWAGYDGNIDSIDSYFTANIQGAIAAGVPVGVYLYSYCKTPDAARRAADETIKLIAPYKISMPVVFDFEESKQYSGNTKATNAAICDAFLSQIESAGYYAMLYTYKSFAESYLDMAALAKYDFWLAHYTNKTTYAGPYGIWQYSSAGRVNGIDGAVDLDIAYKDYPAIISGMKQPAPPVEEDKKIDAAGRAILQELENAARNALEWLGGIK